jgi:YhcG PDDEXK nuclease domain
VRRHRDHGYAAFRLFVHAANPGTVRSAKASCVPPSCRKTQRSFRSVTSRSGVPAGSVRTYSSSGGGSFNTPQLTRSGRPPEFLGFDERAAWRERDLEQAIIDRIEAFLLELGNGFCFVARQKRLTLDGDHFFVDLVLYTGCSAALSWSTSSSASSPIRISARCRCPRTSTIAPARRGRGEADRHRPVFREERRDGEGSPCPRTCADPRPGAIRCTYPPKPSSAPNWPATASEPSAPCRRSRNR